MDKQLAEQIQSIFTRLTGKIGLVYDQADHENQGDLIEFLEEVAATSDKIYTSQTDTYKGVPTFEVFKENSPTGIRFTGIPTGHEFSSLILAILNVDEKGKFPDAGIQALIKAIKGPVRLKTYISLTCENCPDIVQALNQMALIHPDFTHEMVDGAYVQDDIKKLGIQGVPSVMAGDVLISTGKASIADLLERIRRFFGNEQNLIHDLAKFDVAVIGGGPAGVSAAIYAARKGLKTVLIAEKVGGQLNETKGIENFISVPYIEGQTLSQNLKQHLEENNVRIYENRLVNKILNEDEFSLVLSSEEQIKSKAVVVATGAKWRKLNVPGESEYIGRGVAFCPHCDGPFYKEKTCIVVGGGNSGIEAAIDLSGIVKHVTVLEFSEILKADKVLIDKANSLSNISIVTSARTLQIIGDEKRVTHLEYEDRQSGQIIQLPVDGIFIQIGLVPNSQFIKDVVSCTAFGEIEIDAKGRTSVLGIYAAGDVTTVPFKQIVVALGEGAKAGLGLFEDLVKQ